MNNNRKTTLRLEVAALPFVLAGVLASTAAWAQSSAAPSDDVIVVTGTRIHLPDSKTLEPTVRVGSQYLEDHGITNVANAINEIPGMRGSITPAGAQASFGQGVNFANGYRLGTNRTLTLVNGRRVVSSNAPTLFGNTEPGAQVDLNIIPTIMVDRVDWVSIGGAPVYGTDAIAGTVNVILKQNYHGLDLRLTNGVTGAGDNFRFNAQALGGFDFADGRANLTAAISYDHVNGVRANDRSFYRANIAATLNPSSALAATLGPIGRTPANDGRINPNIGFNNSTTDGFPDSVLINDLRAPAVSLGGVLSSGAGAYNYQFDTSGDLVRYNRGILYRAALNPLLPFQRAVASGGDGLNLTDFTQITSTTQRLSANLAINYELSPRAHLFVEGSAYRGKNDELVEAPTLNASIVPQGSPSSALTFQLSNPLLSAQARQQLIALGYTTTFQLSRANTDLVDTTGWSENNVYRVVAGVRGDFQAGGRDFNYEAYLNYGRTDFTDHQPKIDQQHFTNAINQCSTVPTVTGGGLGLPIADAACQPLNLFGQGVESPAALNYITRLATAQSRLQQFVGNANIGGSPFDLLGNPVSFNLGFEHHFEKGSFTPDAYLQGGLGRDVAIPATAGSYAMNEEFGEVLIPVITPNNNFVFSKLEAFGRFRHVDNSVNGAFDAWAVGGSFAPVPDIEFRGNFTRSFRTPSIVEFFSQPTTPFVGILDLCSSANQNAGPVPLTRGANCAAFNAKYPTGFFGTSGGVPSVLAGNPNLRNEVSNSFTYGVVLQPRFIPNLSVTVDYINIKISDPISSLGGTTGAATIAQGCIDNPAFNAADPANGNSWCSLIHRDPNGNVINNPRNPGVVASYVNGKRITMDAIQATLDYATSLSSLGMPGQFGLGATVFNLRNRLVDINGIAPTQSEGLVGDPKWQGQLRLRYADKAWGVTTSFNYTGTQAVAYTNRGANPNDIREFDHFDPYTTVDASIWFSTADAFRMTVAVTNLTNRVGQNYYGVIIPASINDALGRRFTASVSKHF